jgi:DNA-binding NarL/FixJ family response regulator
MEPSDVFDDDFDAAFDAWRHELREARPLRILLVDDNDVARESIAMLLRHDGHQVVGEARDGQAGVEDALRLRPDVVITDCRMPTLDGIEATRRIRATAPAPEVIAFCSTGGEETANAFLRAGAHASIDKRDVSRLRSVLRDLGR